MHYFTIVLVDKGEDVEQAVAEAMEPYGDGREWDWYEIGGRWTGTFSGYDPVADPANADPASPMIVAHTRSGEERRGVKWPTEWAKHEGDIMPVDELLKVWDKEKHVPHTLVADFDWMEKEIWNPVKQKYIEATEDWPGFVRGYLEDNRDKIAVVVDAHN